VLLRDAHAGYISWEEHERIEQQLRRSAQAHGIDRRQGPPREGPAREGPALLQGLAVCGRCGARMSVRYHRRRGVLVPDTTCLQGGNRREHACQVVPGAAVDEAIGQLLLRRMEPLTLELTLAVQAELEQRLDDADRLRQQQVERARYEVELARRRHVRVDPDNRLVADALEAERNERLRALARVREDAEAQHEADRRRLDEAQSERILSLAESFPAIWDDPATPHRERKRMAALLVDDVTVVKAEQVTLHVRLRGGATTTLTLPRALQQWQSRRTPAAVMEKLDALLEEHADAEPFSTCDGAGASGASSSACRQGA
jgi:hypothetical protein